LPPEVWTTLATGLPGEVHGVRSFEVRRIPGMSSPILDSEGGFRLTGTVEASLRLLAFLGPTVTVQPLNSGLRRSPAIWEVMNAAGRLAGVVNWWGTWPAQSEGGVTISDRAFGSLRYRWGNGKR